ncbi:MAG: 16S rRNA (cytosine(967)-C(5))-methyltransferase [Burkholderiaceae bacterium]|jgi:16S rRNA (cytosine967-C5)-methyltransferase|nr:MAG: 16S rRNA (cytosine(967)-C(5))-methyltransferase [Burkholderiaceae bacterium]
MTASHKPPPQPPLWRQLVAAAQVLGAVRAGTSGTAALEAAPPLLRAGVQAIVFETLRRLGRATALARHLAPRTPPAPVDALLCTALALALEGAANASYDDFTLVDQAVEAAKHGGATRRHAGLINACLRRFLRERETLLVATDDDPVAQWNHPCWWIDSLRRDYPNEWQQLLRTNQEPPALTLRVNRRKTSATAYLQELAAMNIEAWHAGGDAVVLAQPRPVAAIPGFAEGRVSVQDAAAQRAAPLLLGGWEGRRGLRLLDACAAPGGKTAHLLELASDAHVAALDIDPARCGRIRDNLQRLGLAAQVLAADARAPEQWAAQIDGAEGEAGFDGVLLDAPCSASGIVRRHPDVRWLRRPGDIARLAAQQAALLAALWPRVKSGGRLLYCTCSVFSAEGHDQIQAFVARNTDARLMPSPGQLLPQIEEKGALLRDNRTGDHDGFYYALLEKRAA